MKGRTILTARDIIVLGASTGGVEALCEIARRLPKNLRATVLAVMHVGEVSSLSRILGRCGHIPVLEAQDGAALRRGCMYVAPPDRHLVLNDGHITLPRGPRENRHRPAVDPLFRSAARYYRERVIGVILTGALDDGSAGLFSIKARGGLAIVQDPGEAIAAGMPRSALQNVDVDHCLPLRQIAPLLVKLTKSNPPVKTPARRKKAGSRARSTSAASIPPERPPGFHHDAVSFVCPECQGPLFETREGKVLKFGCRSATASRLKASLPRTPRPSSAPFGSLSARSMNASPSTNRSPRNSPTSRTATS